MKRVPWYMDDRKIKRLFMLYALTLLAVIVVVAVFGDWKAPW